MISIITVSLYFYLNGEWSCETTTYFLCILTQYIYLKEEEKKSYKFGTEYVLGSISFTGQKYMYYALLAILSYTSSIDF